MYNFFFFSSRRRHTRYWRDWSSDVCSSDLFMIFCMNMLPVMFMMFFLEGILTGNLKSSTIYIGLAIAVSILIYIFLRLEYDAMFNTTYKESANLRTGIAESLSRLPLSYFSKHDLSDLSQTIMSDVEGIEHTRSHAIPKVYGF